MHGSARTFETPYRRIRTRLILAYLHDTRVAEIEPVKTSQDVRTGEVVDATSVGEKGEPLAAELRVSVPHRLGDGGRSEREAEGRLVGTLVGSMGPCVPAAHLCHVQRCRHNALSEEPGSVAE